MTAVAVKASARRPIAGVGRRLLRDWAPPLAAGLLLWAAFAPLRLWGTIFFAWLPILSWIQEQVDARGAPAGSLWKRAGLAGFLFGAGLLFWILALSNEQVTVPGLMIPCLALVGVYYAFIFIFQTAVIRWFAGSGLPLGLVFPILWPLMEWVRTLGPLGFPWGSPGYAFARVPAAVQFTSATGFWGLALWVGLVTGLLHEGIRRAGSAGLGSRAARTLLGAAVLILALPFAYGGLRLGRAPSGPASLAGEGGPVVAIVQPNILREIKWKPGGAEASWGLLERGSLEGIARGAEILVWPETALPMSLLHQPVYLARVRNLLAQSGAALLAGTLHSEGEFGTEGFRSYNSAIFMTPSGDAAPLYHKQKLVPFSERMPLQKVLPFLTMIDFGQSDFMPGNEYRTFTDGPLRLAPLVCFESIFPEVSARFAFLGANALVNVTNDFWFGRTPGPLQHADMALLRAVENGLPLIRCANTGVSFFVDPYGRIVEEAGIFREAVLTARVGPGRPSFAARHRNWLVWLLCGFAGALFIARGWALTKLPRRAG